MVLKQIHAVGAKPGNSILIDEIPCIVKSNDISKPGKHGHAKCRIESVGIIDGKKRVIAMSGHDRLDVPLILKSKAQLLSFAGDNASIMDLESYETLEIPISEELKSQVKEGDQVEYWDIEGTKLLKRKI